MNGTNVVDSVMRQKVLNLQAQMVGMPQADLPTNHYFATGMYARELPVTAGTLIVGKIHKQEHFFIVTKGSIAVTIDESLTTLTAPCVVVSKPGAKRAILAIEDSVFMTVHLTDKTDLDEIEKEIIEPEEVSLFDAHNRLKNLKELP